VSCERIVPTEELTATAPVQSLLLSRMFVTGVVESPGSAHFTSCAPDYGRDESFQRHYVASARDPAAWAEFERRFLSGSEDDYQAAVRAFDERPAVAL
jgi:glutaconate CoA-transferase subunit A